MTRKYFEVAAKIIRAISNREERRRSALLFAKLFAECNERFNEERFIVACEAEEQT